jgi:hypothetical protein
MQNNDRNACGTTRGLFIWIGSTSWVHTECTFSLKFEELLKVCQQNHSSPTEFAKSKSRRRNNSKALSSQMATVLASIKFKAIYNGSVDQCKWLHWSFSGKKNIHFDEALFPRYPFNNSQKHRLYPTNRSFRRPWKNHQNGVFTKILL